MSKYISDDLDKLVKQFEKENPGVPGLVRLETGKYLSIQMGNWLATRPTCGKEQRVFLDEIENKGIVDDGYTIMLPVSISKKVNLFNVQEGK